MLARMDSAVFETITHSSTMNLKHDLDTVCQMGQCSDICATSVFEVKTSLSGFNRLWGDTRVMWTHFFTFLITSCVSEMAQKWSILGQNDNLGH